MLFLQSLAHSAGIKLTQPIITNSTIKQCMHQHQTVHYITYHSETKMLLQFCYSLTLV